jgi:Baseplate J-like protein
VELQLPRIERDGSPPRRGDATGRRSRRLVRCLLQESTGANARGYMHAPAIEHIRVAAVGACVQALHATRVSAPGALPQAIEHDGADALGPSGDALRARANAIGGEVVGYSDGTPGQVFRLRRTPALKLERDDGLDVFDPRTGEWEPWMLRDSFAGSTFEDLHYCFDPVLGEVSLGPAIRERDGWVQRGAIPAEGLALRMRYRTGGGTQGNVEANTLTVMRRAVSGIASVTNPKRAGGGVDAETLGEVRRRAPAELRTHSRAVTAGDFEAIAREASRRVARARCVTLLDEPGKAPSDEGDQGGEADTPRAEKSARRAQAHGRGAAEIAVYVLPTLPTQPADPAEREIELGPIPYDEMRAPDDVLEEVCDALDARRLLGMSVNVRSTPLRGVTVAVEVEVDAGTDGDTVERAVKDVLYRYIDPYTGGARGKGWEYGEPVDAGKIRALVRAVRGVREVPILRLYDTDLRNGERRGSRIEERLEFAPDELAASAKHFVRVVERGA